MEIDFDKFDLNNDEKNQILPLLKKFENKFNIENIWQQMDVTWDNYKCDNRIYEPSKYAEFYSDPIWVINGIFSELDIESISNRNELANSIIKLNPKKIVDFGGGIGALARKIADLKDDIEIDIFEEYPSNLGKRLIKNYRKIKFIKKIKNKYDLCVSTDVLEHVHEPEKLVLNMARNLKINGYLVMANCFRPVIKCHLPSTFHLRYTLRIFCLMIGLEYIGKCGKSHGHIYKKNKEIKNNLFLFILFKTFSNGIYPFLNFAEKIIKNLIRKYRV